MHRKITRRDFLETMGLMGVSATAIAMGLTACSGGGDSSTTLSNSQSVDSVASELAMEGQEQTQMQEDAENIGEEPESIELTEDMTVIAAFPYDRYSNILVENTGEKAILNYKVVYTSFDKNGFPTTSDYEVGRVENANMMKGDKDIISFYGEDGTYIVATVCAVEYIDGTSWEMTNLDGWAREAKATFSLPEAQRMPESLSEVALLAEENEYVTLVDFTAKNDNRYSSKKDFKFTLKNTSEKGVAKVSLFVLEFDENGFPVSVSPYDTFCINGHKTGGTVNLAQGQTKTYSDALFVESTTTNIKAIIRYVEFQDGTEWMNPYQYEWIIANNKNP